MMDITTSIIWIAIATGWLLSGLFGRWLIMDVALGAHSMGDNIFFCGSCRDAADKYSVPFIFLGPVSICIGIITFTLTTILRHFIHDSCAIGKRIKGTTCYEMRRELEDYYAKENAKERQGTGRLKPHGGIIGKCCWR